MDARLPPLNISLEESLDTPYGDDLEGPSYVLGWNLYEILRVNHLAPLDLVREMRRLGYLVGANTIYRYQEARSLIHRENLAGIMLALRSLTGKHISLDDLMPLEAALPREKEEDA